MRPSKIISQHFVWKGINSGGYAQGGVVEAEDRTRAILKLRGQNIRVLSIVRQRKPWLSLYSNKIKPSDITQLTEQLATTLNSGIPLAQSLTLASANTSNQSLKILFSELQQQVASGYSFSQALSAHKTIFTHYYISLIETGESTGQLDNVLAKLAQQRSKSEKLRQKLLKALIYPGVVLVTAILVSALLLTSVVPQFASLFRGFDAELPLFTRQVITLSDWLQAHVAAIVLSFTAVIIVLLIFNRCSDTFRHTISKYSLLLPIYGKASSEASLASFSHALSLNLSSGVPVLTALDNAARNSYNLHYQALFHSVLTDVSTGTSLYQSLKQKEQLPDYFVQMVLIGEQSGTLDKMLSRISKHYELSVDNLTDNLSSLLEPFIMLVLGGIVGAIIISMYLPIFNLMSLMG